MAIVEHGLPCVKCTSSDGMSIDDNGWGHCFVCKSNIPPEQLSDEPKQTTPTKTTSKVTSLVTIVPRAIPDRKIIAETAKFYGVGYNGDDIVFPMGTEAQKIRIDGDKSKQTIKGDFKKATGLFGQEKFPEGGKRIVITEGEFDALALYQMLGKWNVPVVSVRNGSSGAKKDIQTNYKYLDSFEEVIFFFDNDDAGKKAVDQCAEVLSHKAKVVKGLPDYSDANDYLMANKSVEAVKVFWNAKKWTPSGIINGADMYEELMKPLEAADAYYPWGGLNKLTYGLRKRELVTITAGSGLGKSQFAKEIIYHLLNTTEDNIGALFLEESNKKTALGIMSLAVNRPLHLPDCEVSEKVRQEAYDKTMGKGRTFFLDQFGSEDIDTIISHLRYLAKGANCGWILLDHVTMVVSAQGNQDERKALDELMTKLRMFVEETGVGLLAVSHLKRPDKKGHEEGASTSLSQLRGSGAIAHLSDMVIGLERNGQHDDPIQANTTHVRVLKNRFAGVTGKATQLLYTLSTSRMTELEEETL